MKITIRRIGHRILALVGVTVAAVLIAFGQFHASRQEQTIRALSERDVQRLMDTVIHSIESIMLPGQAAIAQSFAERLKTVPDVVDFRIVRTDGNEAFRDNQTLNKVNEKLREKLGTDIFPSRFREEVVSVLPAGDSNLQRAMSTRQGNLVSYKHRDAEGARVVDFIYAIPNQPSCHGCHGADRARLGAVKVSVSMAAFDAKVASTQAEIWVATGVALALVMLLLGVLVHRSVVRPIQAVTQGMERASMGDLKQAVPVPGEDELGQMAQSFNIMMQRLHDSHAGLRMEQDKLNTVLQSTGEGVVLTDGSGAIVLVNEAAVELLGKRRERIIEEGFTRLLDNSAIVETLLARQTSGQAPTPYKVGYKGRTLRVSAATIHAKDGRAIGSAALLRDITPATEPAVS